MVEEVVSISNILRREVKSVSEQMVAMFRRKSMLLEEESPLKSTEAATIRGEDDEDEEQEYRRSCHNGYKPR